MNWGITINGELYIRYSEKISNTQQLYETVLKLNPTLLKNKEFVLPMTLTDTSYIESSSTPTFNPDGSVTWTGHNYTYYKTINSGTRITLVGYNKNDNNGFWIGVKIPGDNTVYGKDISTSDFLRIIGK
ncbi:hypothetical protein J2Z60_001084 [Lactobacillus colini]|uniref:Uncharacterized protein n=1 Tax=Lactobacillus colini TaxID=1819254 RepID=A0ABS4MDY8_9LACO|nr:hypothetical protein [Lactobacillus colini]MBP2057909.1 hypothetical protein [Lactobacillus colini]